MTRNARPWLQPLLCVVVLTATGAITYGQVLTFSFVTKDDHNLIRKNPTVTHWASAPATDRCLTPEFTYAIPITVATWALDWQLWGGRAWGFHLTNLLIHILCGLVLWLAARRWAGDLPALAGALLLLLHPVAAEPVSFITQRKDLLATLFALLALERTLAAARREAPGPPLALALAFAAAAGLCKPSALLLGPAVLGVYALTREHGAGAGFPKLLSAGLALLAPVLLGLHLFVHRLRPGALDAGPTGVAERLALACHTVTHYAQSLLMPLSLSPKVPRPPLTLAWQPVLAALAVVAGLAGLGAWLWRRRHRRGLALWLWCVAAYLPVANLIPLKRYVADSFLYPVLAGLGLGLALTLARLPAGGDARRPLRRLAPWVIAGAWLLGLGAGAHLQAGVWQNESTLFAYLYRLHPDHAEAEAQYVTHLRRTGQHQRARAVHRDFLQRALKRRPGDLAARHHLLRLYLRAGHARQARGLLEQTPEGARARVAHWEAWLEYAMHQHDYPLARQTVQQILALDPHSPRRKLLPELQRRTRRQP